MKNKGITLIALVITIIVVIILAGVTLNLTLEENGIFKKAEESAEKQSESEAREKLEIILANAAIEKQINLNYNQEDFLTEMIERDNIQVIEDIVIVDGWKFGIDRNATKIIGCLGKGDINSEISITINNETSRDFVKENVTIEIAYKNEITNIILGENEVFIPEKQDGKYVLTHEFLENGTYLIVVKDSEGKFQSSRIKVENLTENMNIYTLEDMITFRDKGNMGRTFEGKTVNLMNDINLQGASTNLWTPIGDYASNTELIFKGTFNGNYNTINNLYINSTSDYQGFFGANDGKIEKLNISKADIIAKQYVGVICGYNLSNGMIEKCSSNSNESLIKGSYCIGGICGYNQGIVQECYNISSIVATTVHAAGITGTNYNLVKYCYNLGSLTVAKNASSNSYTGGITGINNNGTVRYSYNMGSITKTTSGTNYLGGIVGNSIVGNVYDSYSSTLTKVIGRVYTSGGETINASIKTEAEIRSESFIDLIGGTDYWEFDFKNQLVILKWQ